MGSQEQQLYSIRSTSGSVSGCLEKNAMATLKQVKKCSILELHLFYKYTFIFSIGINRSGSDPNLTVETFSNTATSGINGFLPTPPLSFQAFMFLLIVK